MGGFVLFDDNGPVRTLDPDELQSLAQDGEIDFPCITENEIRDRSKGDMLSKGLVMIQTGWFILQCIARRIEHLPLTELELVTLAFAALNFVTYGLWWNKSLNVQCPFRVPVKRRTGESEGSKGAGENYQSADDENSGEDSGGQDMDAMAVFGMLITSIVDAMRGAISKTLEAMCKAPGAIVHAIRDTIKRSVEYVHKHRWRTFRNGAEAVVFHGIGGPVESFGAMGFGTYDGVEVGTIFYAGSGSKITWTFGIPGAVIATIFGGIHCVAWSFQFPSYMEQLLWRIASLSITCFPMIAVLWAPMIKLIVEEKMPVWLFMLLGFIIIIPSAILYVLSRVALLVIALMSLRSLPPGAYETVHWTTFIPHV
jgi:hypothetical protein